MSIEFLQKIIFCCGLAHFALCAGSLLIPKMLHWRAELVGLSPLLRQMFWTYAGYILLVNLGFGIISVLAPEELLNKSTIARCVTLFIGLYWTGRIAIQFFYFDKSTAPKGIFFKLGEIVLIALFILFAVSYLVAFLYNISWI